MSQIFSNNMGGGPPSVVVETLTGDTGGPVGPTANNINVPGGANFNTVGNPGTSTVTFNLNETIHWPSTNFAGTIGAIYLNGTNGAGGELFMHNYDGGLLSSTWLGLNAGNLTNAGGGGNTGIGYNALILIGSGGDNTAVGAETLNNLVGGFNNVALGVFSLTSLEDGVVDGASSYNTSLGTACGLNLLTGSWNTIIGTTWGNPMDDNASGIFYTGSESSNILINNRGVVGENSTMRLGTDGNGDGLINATYIAGIFGRTVNAGTGVPVVIDSTGLMGTVVSSRRFKKNIESLNHESEALYTLRTVSFNNIGDGDNYPYKQFGLIAEEVEETFPELVVYQKGEPFTVKYQDLPVLLLNELQKHQTIIQSLIKRINILEELLRGDGDEL